MNIQRIFIALIVVCAGCACAVSVFAQSDIERATSETDRLTSDEIEKKLIAPPKEPPEEKPEEAPLLAPLPERKVFIRKISLTGCESFPPETFSPLTSKYEQKEVSFSELDTLSREIARDYLKRGIIAAVFVPPQEIAEETVIVRVVEAKMGELKVQDHRYFRSQALRKYWRISPGEVLRYDRISRYVQMMNKNPDREVRAALQKGTEPGTTDVVLSAETQFPVHLTYSFDNEGAASSGKYRHTFGIRHNNLLGQDDMALAGYSTGRHFNGLYAYHNLPIGPSGTYLLYGYSYSTSAPKMDFDSFDLSSVAESMSASLRQDLYVKDRYIGEVFVKGEGKDKVVRTNAGTLNRDRLRILSGGGKFFLRRPGTTTTFSPSVSQGLDFLGATSGGNPYASRGASSVFTTFNADIQHRQVLPLNIQEVLKCSSQFATTKLTPQEEFALGGIDSVRGYPPSDYLADNAVLANAEMIVPSFIFPKSWRLPYAEKTLREDVTGVFFFDYGYGERKDETKSHNLWSAGAGVRISLYNQAIIRCEWGIPFGDRAISESDIVRFHLSVNFQDSMPAEFERIGKAIEAKRSEEKIRKLEEEEAKKQL